MKRVLSILIAIILVSSITTSAIANSAVSNPTFDEQQFVDLGKKIILKYVNERESEYYNVESINFIDSDVIYSSDKVSFNTNATVNHILKATDAEELPYVKGFLDALGVDTYTGLTSAQKNDAIKNIIEKDTNAVAMSSIKKNLIAEEAVDVFDGMMNEIESYIGKTTRLNLYFNVSISIDDLDNLNGNTVMISALDSCDNKVDISEYDIRTYGEMFNAGVNDFESNLYEIRESEESVTISAATPINNWDDYDRIAARDYAYAWWGPDDDDYNVPPYSNWNGSGGDCANFVSQCIFAGGVPTDSEWYKDSTCWVSTSSLASYMVNRGYATNESYTNTNAGNFATKPGHSVLVSINNGVDICYTAHNTNRLDAPFSATELSSTYSFYVIKNY